MPDKKPTRHNKGTDKKKQSTHVEDQAEMEKIGTSDPNLHSHPLENFERATADSIQRGQRTVENEKRQS